MEAVTTPTSPPFSIDSQLKNAGSVSLRSTLHPEVVREAAGFARETDRRASRFRLAARVAAAAAAAIVAVAALLYFFMGPPSREADTASTPPEVTESPKVALPLSGHDDLASKPALAQFKGLLATPPVSQPAAQEQSQPLLQQFMQWRQKDNSTETAH